MRLHSTRPPTVLVPSVHSPGYGYSPCDRSILPFRVSFHLSNCFIVFVHCYRCFAQQFGWLLFNSSLILTDPDLEISSFWWFIHCLLYQPDVPASLLPTISFPYRYDIPPSLLRLASSLPHFLSAVCIIPHCLAHSWALSPPPSIAFVLPSHKSQVSSVSCLQDIILSKKQSCTLSKPASLIPSAPFCLSCTNWFSMAF